jgi:hypothetical protein
MRGHLALTCVVGLASSLYAGCGGSHSTAGACDDRNGTYQGTYTVALGDCPLGSTYEASSPSVHATMAGDTFYVIAAEVSCTGTLVACGQSSLAGICGGVTKIGAKQYPDVSRVVFGADGSVAVTGIHKMPSNGKQCILDVSFIGQKTAN